ncbi:DUF6449 domain-containing protein [Anaeromicropila populeti]|uniref:ABC-type transport system involved in multi-copper enzyme maturation, permease component n=1 Tax=Anaeromicropila populeti TaxID=37658 RepID=A0A1I6LJ80_9FIRM|nr:DUF6449 domain-containing protein [Anaeromicropila populeti]SFS03554.1 ABC-type transport system involved in multi-copper enzyme maturation, permease component [Anaeromicropila populeti]
MILKSSFFKIMKEEMKRRIWSIALAMFVLFFTFPVAWMVLLENARMDEKQIDIRKLATFYQYLGPENYFILIVVIVGALICGLNGFCYMHSKKQVDFYHSMPVKRERLFLIKYVAGILIYVVPYVVNMLLAFGVSAINGVLSQKVISLGLQMFLVHFVFYLLNYSIIILAVLLTGNFVINLLGVAVFLFYGPTAQILLVSLKDTFYETYYFNANFFEFAGNNSPLVVYAKYLQQFNIKQSMDVLNMTQLLIIFIVTAGFVVLDLILYKRFASEQAGKALVFKWFETIIKVFVVVPTGLGFALLFQIISYTNSLGWFVFGGLVGFLFANAVMEMVVNMDFRKAFAHRILWAVNGTLIFLASCIFIFDLTGFDSYLPKESKVESAAVYFGNLDNEGTIVDKEKGHISTEKYQLMHMKLTDVKPVFELIKRSKMDSSEYRYNRLVVKFTLKNGKTVYRQYLFATLDNQDMVETIYDTPEYREGSSSLYLDRKWNTISFRDNIHEDKEVQLNEQQKKEFLSVFREEQKAMSLSDKKNSVPIGYIALYQHEEDESKYYNTISFKWEEYSVYPSYSQSIQLLNQYMQEDLTVGFLDKKVVSVKAIYNKLEEKIYEDTSDSKDADKVYEIHPVEKLYTEQKDISEFLPNLKPGSMANMDEWATSLNQDLYFQVEYYFNDRDQYTTTETCYMFTENVPDFVKKDLGYSQQ